MQAPTLGHLLPSRPFPRLPPRLAPQDTPPVLPSPAGPHPPGRPRPSFMPPPGVVSLPRAFTRSPGLCRHKGLPAPALLCAAGPPRLLEWEVGRVQFPWRLPLLYAALPCRWGSVAGLLPPHRAERQLAPTTRSRWEWGEGRRPLPRPRPPQKGRKLGSCKPFWKVLSSCGLEPEHIPRFIGTACQHRSLGS